MVFPQTPQAKGILWELKICCCHRDRCVETSDSQLQSPNRGLGRGAAPALETVQEGSVPTLTSESSGETVKNPKYAGDSGSDSPGNKSAGSKIESKQMLTPANPKSDEVIAKRSFTSLSSARGKIGETSMTNMTVETETVSSIPQVSLVGGAGERGSRKDPSATIRLRASDETIRPKKEKKKTRKPTVPIGTVSSKADNFEAKVASAVDDADSSDSAETFVYESNPPDPHPSRQHRYHSRTPSAASMVGQFDQYGNRLRPGVRDALHGITGKRSMKFTNTSSYNTMDGEGEDRSAGRGSARGNGHMHTARHYHIGRNGRGGAHQPVLDQSPFQSSQSSKVPRHFLGNGHSRNLKRDGDTYGYDFDAEGADDERTPLVGAIRGIRGRNRRPNSSSLRQMEYFGSRRIGFCARYGICALLLMLLLVLTGGSTVFIIGATQSLKNVHVREIQNVLASEQTIMLDLDIEAVNPNLFALTISDMDVNIFAKSRYVGTDAFWRDRGPHPKELPRTKDSKKRAIMARTVNSGARDRESEILSPRPTFNATGGVDKGTDPIPDDDLSGDPQTMLLGRIFHFASPLTFEPSPWKHIASNSTGQVRLTKPGNKTEEGGSLRWERVLQHPFELIVRGVVKYQLPMSSGMKSASISSKINVLPDDGDKDGNGGDHGNDDEVPSDSVHIE
ncbi:predicted protein [Uncinocarpus reesii 1704]|uniref:Phospholipid metabolism enzyme regulator n=1 Tax=Uncinocarpus reesii (strain UAMH 1704) TaxID=336963 RepID=C4JEL1_UNCRE|nr:uncharacterized protein UREG_00850 [Uncinocarpus reesii 1704]EEP76003.1 predicted protein [Uncinocarpus reesii 1704]